MKIKAAIPNVLTAGNMLFGLAAIIVALQPFYYIEYAFFCILLAAACDLFDGMAARLLKVQSEFGKQFDSLCDVVSFGVAPAIITVSVVQKYSAPFEISNVSSWMVFCAPILFALAAGIRLALFNIDTRQTKSFLGLPSPAAGLFLACTSIYWAEFFGAENAVLTITAASLIFAALMLIPVPLLSLKLHDTQSITLAVVMLLVAVPLFIFFGWAAISLVILVYVLTSPLIRYFAGIFTSTGDQKLP